MIFRGDPASALLEVLDPEQNFEFRDHYLDVALDLSEVLFITTANELEPIPGPLRDRMEIIQLSGYTELEKLEIAKQYLVPRQTRENGLRPAEIAFDDESLLLLIRDYTREPACAAWNAKSGARRARWSRASPRASRTAWPSIRNCCVSYWASRVTAGVRRSPNARTNPAWATGLAWTPVGGEVLFVEAARMDGGKGFQYTGQLGEVMQESAMTALSYVRSQAQTLEIDPAVFENNDIHLHVPAGACARMAPPPA